MTTTAQHHDITFRKAHPDAEVYFFKGAPRCVLEANAWMGAGYVRNDDGTFEATLSFGGRGVTRTFENRGAVIALATREMRRWQFDCAWGVS